jgi:hypothetical protein
MRFCLTNYTQCFVIDSAIIFNVLIYEVDLDSSTLLMGNLMRHFLKIFVVSRYYIVYDYLIDQTSS